MGLTDTGFFTSANMTKHLAGTFAQLPTASYNFLGCTYEAQDTVQTFLCVLTAPNTYTWILIASGTSGGAAFGLLAARPTATAANAGMFYYATDIGELFRNVQSAAATFSWLLFQQESIPSNLVTWSTQIAWGINPSTGADTNVGSVASPLATWAEFRRRNIVAGGFAQSLGNVTVTIVGNLGQSDPENFMGMSVPIGTVLIVTHTPATVYTSVVGVVTAKAAPNTPQSFTDPALPVSWTASGLVGLRGRITSGARAGTLFWIAKDLGGKAARLLVPGSTPTTFPFGLTTSFPTLVAGDPFVIETLPTVDTLIIGGNFPIETGDDAVLSRLVLRDASYTGVATIVTNTAGSLVSYIGCKLANAYSLLEAYFESAINVSVTSGMNLSVLGGGCLAAAGIVMVGGSVTLNNILVQTGSIQIFDYAALFLNGDAGVFDSPSSGILAEEQGLWDASGGARTYGSGNTAFGAVLQSSKILYTTLPTITGASDAQVDGITKTWATFPYYDSTTDSGAILAGTSQRAQGTVNVNGATPVPVAVASIQATDIVVLMRTVNGGTPGITPLCVITAGVGFTITGIALDTSTYAWKLQKG